MTAERMRWYADALETSLTGRTVQAAPNIHTDDDVARANGLPGRVADGMITTNWLSNMLIDTFGDAYVRTGSLQTRYRRPITEDMAVEAVVRVRGIEESRNGRTLVADVWCETDDGERRTVGQATVRL
jgi:acyl dehydratase